MKTPSLQGTAFVTGANGFLGSRICRELAEQGASVVALCRTLPNDDRLAHQNIRIANGDILDPARIVTAMSRCDYCFHLAAMAKPWARDPLQFTNVNVEGMRNVTKAAIENGLKRIVFTSTAGVFGPSTGEELLDENSPRDLGEKSQYEQSKIQAEDLFLDLTNSSETDGVIVNPTRVFGPGPLTVANSLTKIISQIEEGSWRMLPGSGNSVGNYVFIEDVVTGHLLAMQNGKPGSRYLLGGENLSFLELFGMIQEESTPGSKWLLPVPLLAIRLYAHMQLLKANWFNHPPKLTPKFAKKYSSSCWLSHAKAEQEIGYQPRTIRDGVKATLDWLRLNGSHA